MIPRSSDAVSRPPKPVLLSSSQRPQRRPSGVEDAEQGRSKSAAADFASKGK